MKLNLGSPYQTFLCVKGTFFLFYANKLGCVIVFALFSYVTKWERLTPKIGKQRKMKFGRMDSRHDQTFFCGPCCEIVIMYYLVYGHNIVRYHFVLYLLGLKCEENSQNNFLLYAVLLICRQLANKHGSSIYCLWNMYKLIWIYRVFFYFGMFDIVIIWSIFDQKSYSWTFFIYIFRSYFVKKITEHSCQYLTFYRVFRKGTNFREIFKNNQFFWRNYHKFVLISWFQPKF